MRTKADLERELSRLRESLAYANSRTERLKAFIRNKNWSSEYASDCWKAILAGGVVFLLLGPTAYWLIGLNEVPLEVHAWLSLMAGVGLSQRVEGEETRESNARESLASSIQQATKLAQEATSVKRELARM